MNSRLSLSIITALTLLGQGSSSAQLLAFQNDEYIAITDLSAAKPKVRKLVQGSDPAISPDGKKIAFVESDDAGDRRIAIVDVASGKAERVKGIDGKNEFMPIWSSDGKTIFFSHFLESDWAIARIDATGDNFGLVLGKQPNQPCTVAPLPSGTEWLCHDLENFAMIKIDAAGKGSLQSIAKPAKPIEGLMMPAHIDISPDGKMALFDRSVDEETGPNDEGPPTAIFMLEISSGAITRISVKGGDASFPCWLPNGKEYLYSGFDKKSSQSVIYRAPLDQSSPPVLVLKKAGNPSISRK